MLINAQLYRPAGAGTHSTVILLHGLPGNEQNLDLARVIQRAGWAVITFHYRGSWGSPGSFTLLGGVADADALLSYLQQPKRAKAWGVNAAHIVVVGHSYGGYVAARIAAAHPNVLAAALIAPWDISLDARQWSALSPSQLLQTGIENFDDVDGRLSGATAASLTQAVLREGAALNLTALASGLANRRLLILTATRDDADDQARGLVASLQRYHDRLFKSTAMETDHGFNDHRIALEIAVLNWLAQLPGAPAEW
jgi:pimeloyl-ACP methyl ester carboxylesterase